MHVSVLKEEVMSFLDPKPGDIVLDATFGGGGHAGEILNRITPGGKLIALDRDQEAVERARQIFRERSNDIVFINGNFRDIAKILSEKDIKKIDGAVFDLGVSSYQLDDASRGFSFSNDGPLDMRLDKTLEISAFDVVNTLGKEDLGELIRSYGEERHYRIIADSIVKERKLSQIRTTRDLSGIIEKAVGRWYSNQKIHPSCRTFQAIRIYVNDEISAVEKGVEGALSMLRPGKRICVISFHSLEDRAVKTIFKREAKFGAVNLVTKKPIVPQYEEIRKNPRSRSAKLRVAERTK